MDRAGIEELFAPIGKVSLRRMFGGHGIYLDGAIFAIEAYGEIWLKADELTCPALAAMGSRPFVYEKSSGRTTAMSYWRLPAEAYDDETLLTSLSRDALAAASRTRLASATRRRPARK